MVVSNTKELEKFLGYPLEFYFKQFEIEYIPHAIGFTLKKNGKEHGFDYPFHPCGIIEADFILKENKVHDHEHTHETHTHSHREPTQEELTLIKEFIEFGLDKPDLSYNPQVKLACQRFFLQKVLKNIYCFIDLWEHNPRVSDKCDNWISCTFKWGRKASHNYKHAYVIQYDEDEGCCFTIWTNQNFGEIDPTYPWNNYDLFQE